MKKQTMITIIVIAIIAIIAIVGVVIVKNNNNTTNGGTSVKIESGKDMKSMLKSIYSKNKFLRILSFADSPFNLITLAKFSFISFTHYYNGLITTIYTYYFHFISKLFYSFNNSSSFNRFFTII